MPPDTILTLPHAKVKPSAMLLAQLTNGPAWWRFLSDSKDAFAAIESFFTVIGIIVAGVWSYMLFVRRREKYPNASLKHRFEFWQHSTEEWHVRVGLQIENTGKVLLRIFHGYTWIQQIKPCPSQALSEYKELCRDTHDAPYEVKWPLIDEKVHNRERELEPGEHDEITMDFFVNKCYEQVLIYTFIENYRKPGRNMGWIASAIMDFNKNEISQLGQGQSIEKPRPGNADNS